MLTTETAEYANLKREREAGGCVWTFEAHITALVGEQSDRLLELCALRALVVAAGGGCVAVRPASRAALHADCLHDDSTQAAQFDPRAAETEAGASQVQSGSMAASSETDDAVTQGLALVCSKIGFAFVGDASLPRVSRGGGSDGSPRSLSPTSLLLHRRSSPFEHSQLRKQSSATSAARLREERAMLASKTEEYSSMKREQVTDPKRHMRAVAVSTPTAGAAGAASDSSADGDESPPPPPPPDDEEPLSPPPPPPDSEDHDAEFAGTV